MASLKHVFNYSPCTLGTAPGYDQRYDLLYTSSAEDTIPSVLIIDSRYRDSGTSSDYTVRLQAPYPDVISVELISCDVPNSNYNISSNNNTVYFTLDEDPDTVLLCTVPDGLYTLDPVDGIVPSTSIRDAIAVAMNDAAGGNVFAVPEITTVDTVGAPKVGVLRFRRLDGGGFTLRWDGGLKNPDDQYYKFRMYTKNSLGQMLGFAPRDYAGTEIYGIYPPQLEMDRFIQLHIEGMERCDSNGVPGAFCVLPLDAKNVNFGLLKDANNVDNATYTYYYIQPRRLDKMHISFKDWQGMPYNFQGQDHVLSFKIVSLSHKRKFKLDGSKKKMAC